MSCFKLYTETFIDIDTNLISLIESSEQTNFEAVNALSNVRRSKLWRTNGYFNVTSSNNQIVFEETAATPLTATIAVAEYSSTASLTTAIKTALEAVGASTYTIAHTNGKFVFTSDGGGGGGILNLLWSDAGSTAASMLGFSTASDDTGALTYTADLIRINTEERLTFDLGAAANPTDFIMVSGDRNSALKLSPSGTYKLQASATNNFSGTPPVDITLTYDDEAIFTSNANGLDTSLNGYRFWSVLISDIDNPVGYIELGAIFLGNHLFGGITERGKPQFPFTQTLIDQSTLVQSEFGADFADERPQTEIHSVQYKALKKDEVELIMDAYRDFGKVKNFFVSFDPDAVFSTEANRQIRYVRFASDPEVVLERPNYFSVNLRLRETL